MKTYDISIRIAAGIERVWRVLVEDLPRDPTAFGITRLDGALAPGGRIKLWSEVDPERAFALRVRRFEAPQRMVWQGGMPFGLFTGTRTFDLAEADGTTTFAMREVFGGALSGLIATSIPTSTRVSRNSRRP
ncbi:MAG: hypothetical protein AAFP13_04170 [Pseudomonadota bacterium]